METTALASSGPNTSQRSGDEAEDLVLRVITDHADSLLRVALRYTGCAHDAQDAYQRGLEILVRKAHTLDPEQAHRWIHTVVKREALAVRDARLKLVGAESYDVERDEERTLASPEERVIDIEATTLAAEALRGLKQAEVKTMYLRAQGLSYAEIVAATAFSWRKVNRCLVEGRASFLARFAGIESGDECRRWQPVLSALVDGEATAAQLTDVRPHLRNCASCRATVRALHAGTEALVAVFPAVGLAILAAPEGAHTPSIFGRAYEAVSGFLHERAALSAIKLQAAAEAIGGGKVAAVAASAAAVAGGGAAAVEHTGGRVRPASAAAATRSHAPVRPAVVAVATLRGQSRRAAPPRAPSPRVPERSRRRRAEFASARRAQLGGTEFEPHALAQGAAPVASAARAVPPRTATSSTAATTSRPMSGGEFDP